VARAAFFLLVIDMKKGIFITLEGIDFSGKTTQARYLINLLRKNGLRCLFLREPGGTKLSERIRRILLSKGEIEICPKSELWLYQAARSQIVLEKIAPALKSGMIVVCDRFYDSTTAYQAYGRGLNKDLVEKANLFATDNLRPDLTLLFDLPEKIAFERKMNLERVKDRLENERLAFFRRVRRGYLELAKVDQKRIKVIKADASRKEVKQAMFEAVVNFLQKRRIRIKI
jgi:dTMP kinase